MGFIGNLPVGLSFFGRKWSEPKLIEIAYAFCEKKTNFRISQSIYQQINNKYLKQLLRL